MKPSPIVFRSTLKMVGTRVRCGRSYESRNETPASPSHENRERVRQCSKFHPASCPSSAEFNRERGAAVGKGLLSKLMADPSNDGPGVKLMDRATIRLQEGDPDGIYISLQMSDVEEFPLRYSLRHGLSCSAYRLWRRALAGSL